MLRPLLRRLSEALAASLPPPYAGRPSALWLWRAAYPHQTEADVLTFLGVLGNALMLADGQARLLTPEDRPGDIFRALYPRGGGDAMELETFIYDLEHTYGVTFADVDLRDWTLARYFEHARRLPRE